MKRQAGVLLHPTSLPNGVLDHHAWRFLDWMEKAGFTVWQMLPLTPLAEGISPYHSDSAFAMNPALLPENWQQEFNQKQFERYLEQTPHWLQDYALFKVLKAHFHNQLWSKWPEIYRYRETKALEKFADKHMGRTVIALKNSSLLYMTYGRQV